MTDDPLLTARLLEQQWACTKGWSFLFPRDFLGAKPPRLRVPACLQTAWTDGRRWRSATAAMIFPILGMTESATRRRPRTSRPASRRSRETSAAQHRACCKPDERSARRAPLRVAPHLGITRELRDDSASVNPVERGGRPRRLTMLARSGRAPRVLGRTRRQGRGAAYQVSERRDAKPIVLPRATRRWRISNNRPWRLRGPRRNEPRALLRWGLRGGRRSPLRPLAMRPCQTSLLVAD